MSRFAIAAALGWAALTFLACGTAAADNPSGSAGSADGHPTHSVTSTAAKAHGQSARRVSGTATSAASTARRVALSTNRFRAVEPVKARSVTARPARAEKPAVSSPATEASDVPYADWNADSALFTGHPSLLNQVFNNALWVLQQVTSHTASAPTSTMLNQATPPWYATLGLTVSQTEYDGMPVYTLAPAAPSGSVVVAVHGGGYVSQPLVFEWLADGAIARQTGATVVVPIYPLAGAGGSAATVVPQFADFLTTLVDAHGAEHVSLMGASAGGGLALAATQELVSRGAATPGRMVLISPWLDATVSDPASQTIWDPLLDVALLQSFGRQWAAGLDPADPRVSPLYGSLAGLPPTTVYSGSHDLLAPDTLRLRRQAIAQGLDMTFVLRDRQFHGWPLFVPLPDAVLSLRTIETQLGLTATAPTRKGTRPRHG
ncbi:alpha/beta hydrolase [Mycobacterium sp. NBC_00419]|uniref:alpha/beta hydrolase n=1 Tax=Mycobacterium sp. NBC_00419 TaxID=2975989 RepID=UPI002E1BFEE4